MSKRLIHNVVILLILSFVGLFVIQLDFTAIGRQLFNVGWSFLWILAISGIAYSVAAIAWLFCFSSPRQNNPSLRQLFEIRLISETLSVTNPAGVVGGDALKVSMLSKIKITTEQAVSSVLIVRILTLLSFVTILNGVLFVLVNALINTSNNNILIFLIASASGLVILGMKYLFSPRLYLYRSMIAIQRRMRWKFILKYAVRLKGINASLSNFFVSHKSKLTIAFVLLLIHWVLGAVEFYAMFRIFEVPILFYDALILEFGTSLFRSLFAFIPFQIGVEELSSKMLLEQMNIGDETAWASMNILRRTRQLFWLLTAGVVYVFIYKRDTVND